MRVKHRVSCKSRQIVHDKVQRYDRKTKQNYEIQLSFGRTFSYCHKFIFREVVKGSRRKEKVDKRTGEIHPIGSEYQYDRPIPHNLTRMAVYRWTKDLPLFFFVIAGGAGVPLVKAAKKAAVRGVKSAAETFPLPTDHLANFTSNTAIL
jgi:hypothetical protein